MTVRKTSTNSTFTPRVDRRGGPDRRVQTGAAPDGVERRQADRRAQYYQDGFDPPAKSPMALTFTPAAARAVRSEAGGATAGDTFYDGSTPAEGTTNPQAWIPVDAPVQGDPSARSAETYEQVINQFGVGENPRYEVGHQGGGETYCNIFAWDVTRAMGAEIPHWVDDAGNPVDVGEGYELDANGVHDWLEESGPAHGWRKVSAEEAQALANQGHPVVASWANDGGIGHIGVVRPGEDDGSGPALAQAGARNFNEGHVYDVFPREGTEYFVNDTGTVAGTQPPATQPSADPAVSQQVADAYRNLLRREPDEGGFANWDAASQAMARDGKSAEEIGEWLRQGFEGGPEFQALSLVDRAFQDVLGRSVAGSRGFWHDQAVGLMRDQGKSAEEVDAWLRANLRGSDEYKLQHAAEEIVAPLYRELLGREPDPEGLATWTGLVGELAAQGKGISDLSQEIAGRIRASEEYRARNPGGVTIDQLLAITPNLDPARAAELLPHLNQAMAEGGIDTPARQAAFLAQLAHESVGLTAFEEYASGADYEGRADLGNTEPGDGVRYKGRGPIQLTGRFNYRAAGEALGLDLENNPTRAADPDVGFRVAVWYWNNRGLSELADAGNFDGITYAINGGYNGKASRDAYWATANDVLGVA